MHWEKLLGYEPAVQRLVRDAGDHDLARVQMVADDEVRDNGTIMDALRQTFEAGASLPPELGLKICALLEVKNPKHKPPETEIQKIRRQIFEEAYAETLGRIRVRKVLDGDPNPQERAPGRNYAPPACGVSELERKLRDLSRSSAIETGRAILCGEVCEDPQATGAVERSRIDSRA
jgi:hypothetical protein